ncbi:DUF5013 domain-containing protein [Siphonobacter sp. SORGH_AS_0500]|uniref:DUF5013 domain-containing protein n=1 Tax=Siphonobacter sp. SORGH_AS_0500 TaxID=1864824 RepID=UPI000CCAB3E9|nr:DUF5013 domain-containing protein [Siphonobacter sp. SORGH_AS_0500]MDR6197917.1 hypothetical protein [Siphonobacter sp. SORGH_AS_0500]PKK37182.1 hypothetical protein BWI96_07460 [Siphonobacter sp. SORGH_AS_0500]
MKLLSFIRLGVLLFLVGMISSCEKENLYDYGISKIYMPQAVNQSGGVNINYVVPVGTDSSTFNYTLNTEQQKLNVILGVSLSGINRTSYSVDLKVDTDTIQQLITNKTLDANTILMPASMYTLPKSIRVAGDSVSKTFYLTLNINELKKANYSGKILALAVGLANPTPFGLSATASKTIVLVDVDALVIGPAVEVTSKYIKNPGNPFVTSAMDPGGRWGTLADWVASSGALSHNGVGGFSKDGDGPTMDMESGWGSPLIKNGKLYQTITLPAGTYAFDPSPWVWQGTKDVSYVVVAPNASTLPDYADIATSTSVLFATFDKPRVTFKLTATTKVTVGVVVNYVQDQQGFKTKAVHLYSYPKHL